MMGAGLAKAAYAVANRLGIREHAPVRAYVYMAVTALDSDPEPSYFGGRDALADALALSHDKNGYRSLERSLQALALRGLVATRATAGPGKNARYGILDGAGHPLASHGANGTPDAERRPFVHSAEPTPDAERRVNNSRMPDVERPNARRSALLRPTLSVGPKEKEEYKEEGGDPRPTRSCTRHTSWEHDEPCRACGNDRRAAEAAETAARVRVATTTKIHARGDCIAEGRSHRWLSDGTCMICPTLRERIAT